MTFSKEMKKWIGASVLAFVILFVSGFALHASLERFPKREGIHAAFLSNGQAYFGTVVRETRHSLVLEHVFYLEKAPLGASDGEIALLKLGNEFHGPEDRIEINQEQILFLEKLKDESKVTQAIKAYKK